jgi:hypothetical protein
MVVLTSFVSQKLLHATAVVTALQQVSGKGVALYAEISIAQSIFSSPPLRSPLASIPSLCRRDTANQQRRAYLEFFAVFRGLDQDVIGSHALLVW